VITLSCGISMGEARHVAIFIIGYRSSKRHSGSCRAPRLAATGAASPAALSALAFLGEG
jgi:hypothetical protein